MVVDETYRVVLRHAAEPEQLMRRAGRGLLELVDRADGAGVAVAGALVGFAHQSGAEVVAEGIETAAELASVCALGIDYGQGYYLGRPQPLHGGLFAGVVSLIPRVVTLTAT